MDVGGELKKAVESGRKAGLDDDVIDSADRYALLIGKFEPSFKDLSGRYEKLRSLFVKDVARIDAATVGGFMKDIDGLGIDWKKLRSQGDDLLKSLEKRRAQARDSRQIGVYSAIIKQLAAVQDAFDDELTSVAGKARIKASLRELTDKQLKTLDKQAKAEEAAQKKRDADVKLLKAKDKKLLDELAKKNRETADQAMKRLAKEDIAARKQVAELTAALKAVQAVAKAIG